MPGAYGTSLMKAVRILTYISMQDEPEGVSAIARGTKLTPSTTYKLLESLQDLGLVRKSAEYQTYSLGLGLLKLASGVLDKLDLVKISRPYLEDINQVTGETVHLAVRDGFSVVYVEKLESTQPVRMYSRVGRAGPLHCTGVGKAMLAVFSPQEIDQFFREIPLKRFTDQTITSESRMRQEIEKIRELGYAVDHMEHSADVECVAVPLYGEGTLYGAISVGFPTYRVDDETIVRFAELLQEAQKKVVEALGLVSKHHAWL